jgi:glycosyltransferase involved in cell wall biosynthesis
MNILFVNNTFYPVVGGVQKYIYDIINAVRTEYNCTVLTGTEFLSGKTKAIELYEYDSIPVIRLKTFVISGLSFLTSIRSFFYLIKLLKSIDIIHLNTIKFLFFVCVFLKPFYRYQLVLSSHGFIFHKRNNSVIKRLYFTIIALFLKRIPAVLCDSRQDYEIALRYGIRNLEYVQVATDVSLFYNVAKRSEIGNYLYFGRIDQNKGLEHLFRQLGSLKKEFKLTVIGSAEAGYLLDLQNGIPERLRVKITWLSGVSDNELLDYISRAEVVLLPSLYEGFGITLIEALASGTPVVAHCNTAYTETLNTLSMEDMLFDYVNGSDFEVKIDAITQKKIDKNIVVSSFSLQKMIDKMKKIYSILQI